MGGDSSFEESLTKESFARLLISELIQSSVSWRRRKGLELEHNAFSMLKQPFAQYISLHAGGKVSLLQSLL